MKYKIMYLKDKTWYSGGFPAVTTKQQALAQINDLCKVGGNFEFHIQVLYV